MAELADQEWPSLAPIRTSCSSISSNSSSFQSFNSSGSHPLSHHAFHYSSPPSSSCSSSHAFGLLHAVSACSTSSTSLKGQSLLSKCLPPRPIINSGSPAFRRQCKSGSPAGGDMRKPLQQHVTACAAVAGAGAFRSYASFPGAKGTICSSTAAVAAAATAATAMSSQSGPLQSNANCRGHLVAVNAFTMIPAAVVGKKKPLDYLSDEPTSPEVTCMGKVRRSKNSACTWDALVNGSEKRESKKKARQLQIEYHHANRGNLDCDMQLAASIPRPICMDSCGGAKVPKWRKIISIFKDIRDLHTPHLQRKLMQEDLIIDLEQLRHRTQHIPGKALPACNIEKPIDERTTDANAGTGGVFYTCQSGEEGSAGEERYCSGGVVNIEIFGEDGALDDCGADSLCARCARSQPPKSCLLLMRNKSARSKVFHDDDDGNYGGAKDDENGGNGCTTGAGDSPSPCLPTAVPRANSDPPLHVMHPSKSWSKKQAALSFLGKQKGFWKSKKLNSSFIKGMVAK